MDWRFRLSEGAQKRLRERSDKGPGDRITQRKCQNDRLGRLIEAGTAHGLSEGQMAAVKRCGAAVAPFIGLGVEEGWAYESRCNYYRLCQICAACRAGHLVHEFRPWMERRAESPGKAFLVTLTARDQADLVSMFNSFSKHFERLRNLIQRKRRSLCGVTSAVGSFETTIGKGSGLWHVHYHGLWFTDGRYRNSTALWEELRPLWAKYLGYSPQVSVKEVRAAADGNIGKALCEVLKYPLKFHEMEPERTVEAAVALKGRQYLRVIQAGDEIERAPPGRMVNVVYGPWVEWSRARQQFVK